MNTFGHKINLSSKLTEDLVPINTGFESATSDVDNSTDYAISPHKNLDDTEESTSSSRSIEKTVSPGINKLVSDFQALKQTIALASNYNSDEQKSLVSSIITDLINNIHYTGLLEYYNLNTHLIAPQHLFRCILDLGATPSKEQAQTWIHRFEGVVMERGFNRETELLELKQLFKNVCTNVQSMVIDYKSEAETMSNLIQETRQIQTSTHDTLIQLQEVVNDIRVPELPQAKIPKESKLPLVHEWTMNPMKISWASGAVKVFLGKLANHEDETQIIAVAKLIKKLSLSQLQMLNNTNIEQLLSIWNVMENKTDVDEFVSMLVTFTK